MTDHDDLEQRLVVTLRRRAQDISSAPDWRPASTPQASTRPRRSAVLVAAAVVALLVGVVGTVLAIQQRPAGRSSVPPLTTTKPAPQTSAPSGQPCTVPAPTGWRRAITAGAVPLDQPGVSVLSVNGALGDYLVSQSAGDGHPGAGSTLAVFDGSPGADLPTDPLGEHDIRVADPSSAVTAGWITWGLTRTQNNSAYYRVELYDRAHRSTQQIAALTPAEQAANAILLGAPVLTDDALYWLESVYDDPARSVLHSYDLASGKRAQRAVPGAGALVGYGAGVGVVVGADQHRVLQNAEGRPLPRAVTAATTGADRFFYAAGVLSWTVFTPSASTPANAYFRYRIDSAAAPVEQQVAGPEFPTGPDSYPLLPSSVAGSQAVYLDSRSGARVRLPAGVGVAAAVDGKILFLLGGDKLGGGTGLSQVPLAGLPPVRC